MIWRCGAVSTVDPARETAFCASPAGSPSASRTQTASIALQPVDTYQDGPRAWDVKLQGLGLEVRGFEGWEKDRPRANSWRRPSTIPIDRYVGGYCLHAHRRGDFSRYALTPCYEKK